MGIIKKFRIKSFKNVNSIIEFKNVTLSYGKRIILDNINFKINEGQIFGMLGPNGVGKSTIFNLITGLIKPDYGTINFDNINAISWDKGCYVGQEITARMKYRALLKKRLYAMKIISGKINVGDKIIENEYNLGEVISKSNQYLFCMLKIEKIKEKSLIKELLKINSSLILKFL